MIAPSDVIRRAFSTLSPDTGMIRIHTLGDDTIRIVRKHGGWIANFKADRLSGSLIFVTDGPTMDIILTDTDTSVSQKLSLFSASVGRVTVWDGKQEDVLWEVGA